MSLVAVSWTAAARKALIGRSGKIDSPVNLAGRNNTAVLETLPYRGDGSMRPRDLCLPPARMPLVHDRRPLKRWRYCGVYGEQLMLCAATVRIAGIPQAFWAVVDRSTGELHERTAFTTGLVAIDEGRMLVSGRGVTIDLSLQASGEPVEIVSRHGGSYIWTRKQPIRAGGRVDLASGSWEIDAAGLIDASAGYHARHTAWQWSAGVGTGSGGQAICWNLVDGVHDAPTSSERTVWIDGAAQEVAPVRFQPGLSGVRFAEDGAGLDFTQEAERAHRDDLKLFVSEYAQPFGSFSGTLPGGIQLERGFGVMERHDVRW